MFKNSQSKSNEKKLIDPATYHPKSIHDNVVMQDGKFVGVKAKSKSVPKKVVKK